MPDTFIPAETLATSVRSPRPAPSRSQPFLNADQMRALWLKAAAISANWDSKNEDKCGELYNAVIKQIADARTLDPIGIAYKLLVNFAWRDRRKGLAKDLKNPLHDVRAVARIIKDTGVLDHADGKRTSHAVPSRLRPLWEAYQATWKHTCDVMDEEDAAMVARPKDVEPGSTEAEMAAKAKRKLADQAFNTAFDALQAAPTKTFDDALCRIEWAIEESDETVDSEIIAALSDALRVLRKVKVATTN